MQTNRVALCLLAVVWLAVGMFGENNHIPNPPVVNPAIAYTHSLNSNPYGLASYNASSHIFTMSGAAVSVNFPPLQGFCTAVNCPRPVLGLTVQVDNSGNLTGGNPNGPDFILYGQITNGATTYTSPLLIGRVTEFFYDGVNDTPNFRFRIAVIDGTMAPLYFSLPTLDNELWMTVFLENLSGVPNFTGSFLTNFGGQSKGDIYGTESNLPSLVVTCGANNTGDVGVPFDSGPMTVTGGLPPYTFSIVGTLPAGLTLNMSTGEVSGRPTASGTFTVKVTDAVGNSNTSCMITISGPLSVTCGAKNTGEVGVPFDSGPITVTGGVAPYAFSIVGILPPGLTLNTSTGEVSGTPTASGTFTVRVTDAVGHSDTSCMITINGPLSVTCGAANIGEVGEPFNSGQMTVTGGVAPYTFSIVGTLPAGLTLNTSTGEVSGTPTASGTFTVKVTDAVGNSSTSCVITINGPLSVTCGANNTGEVGVPFDSEPITVTGGVAPYAFSIVGILPAGLKLNTGTGEVSGTPTAAGTFTVRVTDAVGHSNTSCMITINGPLSVTCGAANIGEVGVPFDSGPMTVTGGVAPYRFSIVGTLPPGLTLNTGTGEVSGTPTASGTFTVKVTDAVGNSSTSCVITINGPLSVTCASVNTGYLGQPFDSEPMTVTGGVAPYKYSIVGTLPPGLTLNTSNGEVTGTPTAAGSFTVKVTDAVGNSNTSCMITISNAGARCTISGQMEGDQTIHIGDWIAAGFSFSFAGTHPAENSSVTAATVSVHVSCTHGGPVTGNIVVPLDNYSVTVPAGDTNWFPTAQEQVYASYQGSLQAPDLCSGGPMYNASQEGGATFSGLTLFTPGPTAQVRFHYRDARAKSNLNIDCSNPAQNPNPGNAAACGASWSSTQSCGQ